MDDKTLNIPCNNVSIVANRVNNNILNLCIVDLLQLFSYLIKSSINPDFTSKFLRKNCLNVSYGYWKWMSQHNLP